MDSSTAVAIAVAVAIGTMIGSRRQRAQNKNVAASIEPVLRDKGPLTLPQLVEALGTPGITARGRIAMALNEMAAQGKVEIIPAPKETTRRERMNVIQYRLRG